MNQEKKTRIKVQKMDTFVGLPFMILVFNWQNLKMSPYLHFSSAMRTVSFNFSQFSSAC